MGTPIPLLGCLLFLVAVYAAIAALTLRGESSSP